MKELFEKDLIQEDKSMREKHVTPKIDKFKEWVGAVGKSVKVATSVILFSWMLIIAVSCGDDKKSYEQKAIDLKNAETELVSAEADEKVAWQAEEDAIKAHDDAEERVENAEDAKEKAIEELKENANGLK